MVKFSCTVEKYLYEYSLKVIFKNQEDWRLRSTDLQYLNKTYGIYENKVLIHNSALGKSINEISFYNAVDVLLQENMVTVT